MYHEQIGLERCFLHKGKNYTFYRGFIYLLSHTWYTLNKYFKKYFKNNSTIKLYGYVYTVAIFIIKCFTLNALYEI